MTSTSYKDYLGDSVYADWDGFSLVLTTENDASGPSNRIVLETEIILALEGYLDRLKTRLLQESMKEKA